MSRHYPIFVKRDLDGFFGLFIDNLVQLLLILGLCSTTCGMSGGAAYLVALHILPGAAVSILIGNLFYSWQAHRLARRTGRGDVTALPYGINTPSLLVFVFFVMVPTYQKTQDPVAAWHMGLVACLGSGLIELIGSFVAETVRRGTPRAALLATLAGIAIGFISMTFALEIWQYPIVAMLPMGFVLVSYFARVRFPLGLPGGFLAVLAGTAIAWVLPAGWTGLKISLATVGQTFDQVGVILPQWAGGVVWETLEDAFQSGSKDFLGYLSVIIPMGLFNVLGSLQNIESAEAAGDRYPTAACLAANGAGTIAAALFGSCFPTTIYIGHPGWKALGARSGYSVLNGLVVTLLCLTGTVATVSQMVPIQAGIAIVLWIGIIITAQAYQATPTEHSPAVAIGLFPAIAAWGATLVTGTFNQWGNVTMEAALRANATTTINGFLLHGMHVLERGYIFTCMILAAIAVHLIERRFLRAALWSLAASALSATGIMHAYKLSGNTVDYYLPLLDSATQGFLAFPAYNVATGYLIMALFFAGIAASNWPGRAGPGNSNKMRAR